MPIISAKFLKSGAKLEHCPDADRAEFAFIGRSNVGKSSLINALCKRKTLVQTSPKPGKTQLMNFFDVVIENGKKEHAQAYLTDLPGYGYAKVSKDKRYGFEAMIIEYLTKRENLEQIFVLIDSNIPPQQIDIEFIQWISGQKLPYTIVFTKSDKPTQKSLSQHIKLFLISLSKANIEIPSYLITNAVKQWSIRELEQLIEKLV